MSLRKVERVAGDKKRISGKTKTTGGGGLTLVPKLRGIKEKKSCLGLVELDERPTFTEAR